MKKYYNMLALIILFQAVIQTSTFAQNNTITIPLSTPANRGKLKVDLNSGSITVKGTSRKDVLITYSTPGEGEKTKVKSGKDDSEGSKAGLKRIEAGGLDLEVTEYQNSVKVGSGSWTKRLNIEIEIPSGFDLDLHTYNNGFIMVTNVAGSLELENYNGKVTALNISGSVVASTYNGDIKVTFDKAANNTPMSFSTYNGDIDISVPSDYKTTIKARSEGGSIYSDFDVQFRSSGPVLKKEKKGDVYKVVVDEWKLGDINGGGAELTLQNYSGDLILRKK